MTWDDIRPGDTITVLRHVYSERCEKERYRLKIRVSSLHTLAGGLHPYRVVEGVAYPVNHRPDRSGNADKPSRMHNKSTVNDRPGWRGYVHIDEVLEHMKENAA